jgi:hypothetical protein
MKVARFALCILLLAPVCWTGCEMFANHTNPIAGWRWSSLGDLDSKKAITEDYQIYINKLPPEERKYVGSVSYSEDGTGQHAVTILVISNGTGWSHVLIYDKDNKRIKTVKYISGHYRC